MAAALLLGIARTLRSHHSHKYAHIAVRKQLQKNIISIAIDYNLCTKQYIYIYTVHVLYLVHEKIN